MPLYYLCLDKNLFNVVEKLLCRLLSTLKEEPSVRTSLYVAPAVSETLTSLSSRGLGHRLTFQVIPLLHLWAGFDVHVGEGALIACLFLSHAESHVML